MALTAKPATFDTRTATLGRRLKPLPAIRDFTGRRRRSDGIRSAAIRLQLVKPDFIPGRSSGHNPIAILLIWAGLRDGIQESHT